MRRSGGSRLLVQVVFVLCAVGTLSFLMSLALPGDAAYRIAAGRYGYDLVDTSAAEAVRAGLAGSNGEVRRAIANNALSVNDKRVSEATATVTAADLNADGVIKLSHGRKKHILVRAT